MNLNNKGFTLVEVLAVIVILSILIAIMVPNVNHIINKNKEENYKSLKAGIINATKVYLSDNRYNIKIEGSCNNLTEEKKVLSITENGDTASIKTLIESRLPIGILVENGLLSTTVDQTIENPLNNAETLNLATSYVLIKYQCSTKDYTYTLVEGTTNDSLKWQ